MSIDEQFFAIMLDLFDLEEWPWEDVHMEKNTPSCWSTCVPSVGCGSCTCPDCGVVGLPYVCGSPADPSEGQDCFARQRALRAARA